MRIVVGTSVIIAVIANEPQKTVLVQQTMGAILIANVVLEVSSTKMSQRYITTIHPWIP
jgi:C4-type Zn-finger protein